MSDGTRTPEQEALSMAVKAGADLVELYEREQVRLEKRVAELEGALRRIVTHGPSDTSLLQAWPAIRDARKVLGGT